MAKAKSTKATEPAETPEVETEGTEEVDYNTKVKPLHRAHAKYIKDNYGVDVDPLAIFLTYSSRVAFRKTSDEYQASKSEAEELKAKEAEEKEAAKAAKAAEREAAKAEKEAEKAAKKEAADKAKAEKEAAEADAEPAEKPAAKGKGKAAAKPAAKGGKKPF